MTTLYMHMKDPDDSDSRRELELRRSRTDRANFDLDVDDGAGTALTLFSLTPDDVRELGKGCAFVVAQLVRNGAMTIEEARATFEVAAPPS